MDDYKILYESLDEFLEIYSGKSDTRYQMEFKERAKAEHIIESRRANKGLERANTYIVHENKSKENQSENLFDSKNPDLINQSKKLMNRKFDIANITNSSELKKLKSCPNISNLFGGLLPDKASKSSIFEKNQLINNNNQLVNKLGAFREVRHMQSPYNSEILSNMSRYKISKNHSNLLDNKSKRCLKSNQNQEIVSIKSVSSFDLKNHTNKKKRLEDIEERSCEDDSGEKNLVKTTSRAVTLISYMFFAGILFFDLSIFDFVSDEEIAENFQDTSASLWDSL